MLLADMSAEFWAFLVALSGGLGVGITKLLDWLTTTSKAKIEQDNKRQEQENKRQVDAVDNLQMIVDRLERQVERLEKDSQDKQVAINRLRDLHQQCQIESAELRSYIQLVLNYLMRANHQLRSKGADPEDVPLPPLPPKSAMADNEEVEFLQRTTSQNSINLKEINAKITKDAETTAREKTNESSGGG